MVLYHIIDIKIWGKFIEGYSLKRNINKIWKFVLSLLNVFWDLTMWGEQELLSGYHLNYPYQHTKQIFKPNIKLENLKTFFFSAEQFAEHLYKAWNKHFNSEAKLGTNQNAFKESELL